MTREIINEKKLDRVVGGMFSWRPSENSLKFTHEDGTVTEHVILDFEKGWERSHLLFSQKVREEEILADLIRSGYVK